MFYRSFKLEEKTREPYRDKHKNLICPMSPISLRLINYRGVENRLHGCLVAELSLYAKVRRYRGKRFDEGIHVIQRHVQVGGYQDFISKARSMAERFKEE